MKQYLILILWIFIFNVKLSPAQTFTLIKSVTTESKYFTTDKLGNFYVIENSEIKKYDSDGIFLLSYNYKNLGTINYIDATDPFKVMLFQPEFLKIRTLDSRMNMQGEINLNYFNNLGLPKLACVTDDGNFWIYDQQNQRLIKIDQKGTILLTGNSFNQFVDQSLNPKNLIAADNFLLMRNNDSTIFVFDKFGNYYRNIILSGLKNFQAGGNQLFYFKDDKMFSIDLNNLKESTLETPQLTGASQVRLEQHRLYVKRNNQLELYSF